MLGVVTEIVGRHTRLPRVTLLIVLGVVAGPVGLGVISQETERWYPLVANMALSMIGFLLGGKLTRKVMAEHGRELIWLSLVQVVVTLAVVTAGLWLIGVPLSLALLLGAIATATDPAATNEVIREYRASGPFTNVLRGVVAIDDAWGLIVFSLVLVAVQMINGDGYSSELLLHGFWELGGAVLIGLALGIPMAYLTGRIRAGEPTLVEALGMVFLCAGVSLWAQVSYLLAAVVMGVTVANFAYHHSRPFHAIEDIEWPFLVIFFVLSGASLSLGALMQVGWLGVSYLLFRILGRILGGLIAAVPGWSNSAICRWSGAAMLPQAGVAMAMVFLALQVVPEYGEVLLPVVIASTIVFEILGPIVTRFVLFHMGEAEGNERPAEADFKKHTS